MKLNLQKVIEKLPNSTTIKSTQKDVMGRKKKTPPEQYPGLGDVDRFKEFPDSVDMEFISLYREGLDRFLIPYIQYGELTVHSAHTFIENLVEQIFGNNKHFGIFSYLKEKNYENSSDRELVRTAERLINSGWRVQRDKNTERYKIINSEGIDIIDATGVSEFFSESSAVVMDASAAHLFIDGNSASKIESLARVLDMNADSLAEIDSLESLIIHTEDKKLIGKIINYKKLRNILSKNNSYPSHEKGTSFLNLYEQGFTLSDRMIFSHDDRVILENGKDEFIIYPVSHTLNQRYGVHTDVLALVASNVKNHIFRRVKSVTPQALHEIKDLGRVFALMSPFWDDEKTLISYSDMADSLNRMDSYVKSGEITRNFYEKVFSSLATIVVTESVLLGNNWLSLNLMPMDTISGRFYSYASRDVFTDSADEFRFFSDNYTPSKETLGFSHLTQGVYPFRLDSPSLPALISILPSEYFEALSSLTIDASLSNHNTFELHGVLDRIRMGVDFILTRRGE